MAKKKRITRVSEASMLVDRTDWAALARMSDADIGRAVASDPDAPPLWTAQDWDAASVWDPPPKTAISIRLDDDVLDFFRSLGPGYQSRMNAVLRAFMLRAKARNAASAKPRKRR